MRYSISFITIAYAGLVIAGPMNLVKKALVTEIETETVIVYVTAGDEPAATAPPATTTPQVEAVYSALQAPVSHAARLAPGVVNLSRTSSKSSTFHPTSSSRTTPSTPKPPSVPNTSHSSTTSDTNKKSTSKAATTPVVVVTPTPAATSSPSKSDVTSGGTAAGGSASSGCSGLKSPTDYISTALYWHNIHRCNHSASALDWDSTLASNAAVLAATCTFRHDITIGGGGYGQNIASFGSTGDIASLNPATEVANSASEMWYNGELPLFLPEYYGESNPDFSNFESWGHFTQLVWQATTKVGCATHFCQAGSLFDSLGGWFTVCNYNPAGNIGGAYGTNVKKPLAHGTVHV